jgi:hypothetical protein
VGTALTRQILPDAAPCTNGDKTLVGSFAPVRVLFFSVLQTRHAWYRGPFAG